MKAMMARVGAEGSARPVGESAEAPAPWWARSGSNGGCL